MTLTQRVLEYMQENGSISSLEAFKELGATRLSAIIFNLRKQYDIIGKDEISINRWGDKVRFTRYYLNK